MNVLQNMSIRWKQKWIIMLTCGLSLLLACLAVITYDSFAFRRELVESVSSLAEVVGNNTTAAIDFDDPGAAEHTLSALRGEPSILYAHVHLPDGREFASFHRAGTTPSLELPHTANARHDFVANQLHLVRPITHGAEQIGTIQLVADLDEFRERLWRYAGIVGLVFIASMLAAFGLSSRLERVISQPILHLAQVARSVALDKNYAVRATKRSDDEVGQLIEGFNEMLEQIQARDLELGSIRDGLERRVELRTHELASSLSLLHATLESTADGVLVIDRQNRVTSYNSKFAHMWRLPLEKLDGGSDVDLLRHAQSQLKDGEAFLDQVKEVYAHPEAESHDILELTDGRVYERYSQPQRHDGQCVGRVWCFRDITERKRAGEALEASVARGLRQTSALITLTREELLATDEVKLALQRLTRISAETLGVSRAGIWRYNEAGTCICCLDLYDLGRAEHSCNTEIVAAQYPVYFQALNELDVIDASDAHSDPRTSEFTEAYLRPFGIRSMLDAPIRLHGTLIGVVCFEQMGDQREWMPDEKTFAIAIANLVALRLEESERRTAEEALRQSESQFRLVWDTSADGMRLTDRTGTVVRANDAYCRMVEKSKEELEGQPLSVIHSPNEASEVMQSHQDQLESDTDLRFETEATLWNGRQAWFELSSSVLELEGRPRLLLTIFRDITRRKQSEADLQQAHKRLLDVSRAAGMAEVATSVLHNVGNVLNSVTTSAAVVADRLKSSKPAGVMRVVSLLEEHRHDPARLLASNGKVDQIITFLRRYAEHLDSEQRVAHVELAELTKNIEHIREIVAMQQSYARVSGVTETVRVSDLVDDALRMNEGALVRHRVRLVRDYAPDLPEITLDKHKVLQILVNLIRNGKYACDEAAQEDKQLTVRVTRDNEHFRIIVADNGVGIKTENLARIFNHGFTTRKHGHGFGLHSGALAAKELGGTLSVHSDGPGQGAAFTLELPFQPGRRACLANGMIANPDLKAME